MKTSFLKNVKQVMFLLLVALCSFVGIAQTTQPHVTINPIGGSKTPDTGGLIDIGGNRPPVGELKCDIGGRGDVGTGALACTITTSDQSEIGGRQEAPTSPISIEIGGRDSSGGLGSYTSVDCQSTKVNCFINDIGGRGTGSDTGQKTISDEFASILDIGGRNTGGELAFDIGGRSQEPTLFIDATYVNHLPKLFTYS